jgi:3-isopropylmalate/(R)-2-methylmalate dehydratase small subunit
VTTPFQDRFEFRMDPFRRDCLMKGLDEIGLTLAGANDIDRFETQVAAERSWL